MKKYTGTIISNSPRETMELAREIAAKLKCGDVVALDGPLGAGKTCFVRGLASGLNIDENAVSSPTFVLIHEYAPAANNDKIYNNNSSTTLIHIDAYRIRGSDDLESIGWDEILQSSDNIIIAVEWPENLGTALPEDRLHINLDHLGESQRQITIEPKGKMGFRKW